MKKVLLVQPFIYIFLFLIIFSIPTFAYETVAVNTTFTNSGYWGGYGFRCSAMSGSIYCYMIVEYSSGTHDLKIVRWNATGGDYLRCDTNYGGSMSGILGGAFYNSSMYLFIGSGSGGYATAVDISNVTNYTSCDSNGLSSPIYSSIGFQWKIQNGAFYNVSGNASGWNYFPSPVFVRNSTTGAVVSLTPINNTIANNSLLNIVIPDVNDNSTMFGTNENFDYIYEISNGVVSARYDNIYNIYGINVSYRNWDMVKDPADGTLWIYFYTGGVPAGNFYRANFSTILNSSSNYSVNCNYVNETLGTVCDANDGLHRSYTTNKNNCEVTSGSCPIDTICSQLTPQINVSTDLVENLTDCQVWVVGVNSFKMNCFNICFGTQVIYSTCYASECKKCPDSTGAITINNQNGHYTKTWYSNQATVSVPSYTISCINLTTGAAVDIIDQNGNSTTEVELLTRAGNTVTASESNASAAITQDTQSLNYLTSNPANYIAMSIGGIFSITNLGTAQNISSILLSFVISIALVMMIAVKGKGGLESNTMMNGFLISMLGMLAMFTLMSWFPAWLFICIMIIGAYLIARQSGVGGD